MEEAMDTETEAWNTTLNCSSMPPLLQWTSLLRGETQSACSVCRMCPVCCHSVPGWHVLLSGIKQRTSLPWSVSGLV